MPKKPSGRRKEIGVTTENTKITKTEMDEPGVKALRRDSTPVDGDAVGLCKLVMSEQSCA